MAVVKFANVSKRYVIHHERARSLQDLFIQKLSRRSRNGTEEFWALRDVSFEMNEGEMVGVIGPNGAGKSTLLKLLARIIEPTRGTVQVKGRVNALIELSAGFHDELSGRENIYLSAALLGLSRKEIQRHFDEIVSFSELEKFLDTPVKHYSSGMRMRLGFAIATCIESEVLLVDEVLAVGDAYFQRKCFERIARIRERGTTILLVSHQLSDIERHCERALLIVGGRMIADGATIDTAKQYQAVYQQREPAQVPDFYKVEYIAFEVPRVLYVGERAEMQVTIRNDSQETWNGEQGTGARMVSLSYHWLDRWGNMHQFMNPRKILPCNLNPGDSISLNSYVLPPTIAGPYILELDLAAESAGWFGSFGKTGPQLAVQVLPERVNRGNGNHNTNDERLKIKD